MMAFFRTLVHKVWSRLLGLLRISYRAICCRKRLQNHELVLPITVANKTIISNSNIEPLEDWNNWDDEQPSSSVNSGTVMINMDQNKYAFEKKEMVKTDSDDDFFKDMAPQFRKTKKLIVETDHMSHINHKNRLAVDTYALSSMGADLGLLEENQNQSNWEVCDEYDEIWDPDSLIREKKLAEREKKIAEHQRRKQEKEALRAVKQNPSSSKIPIVSLVEGKDKSKHS